MFSRFFNKAPVEPEKEKLVDNTENTFSVLSTEKLKALITILNEAEPIFRQAGFLMEQLNVVFGSKPKLKPHFKQLESISNEQHEMLLEELKDQQLISFIIISLHKSSRMQPLFENSELYYYGMEIDISSVPSVTTIFKRKEPKAEVIALQPKS